MDLVGSVIAPEHRLEIRVRDLEVSPRLRGLEEATIRVQRFGPALLEDDPSAKLAIKRAVDLPLADERASDLVTCGAGFLRAAGVFLGKRVQTREQLVQGFDLRGQRAALGLPRFPGRELPVQLGPPGCLSLAIVLQGSTQVLDVGILLGLRQRDAGPLGIAVRQVSQDDIGKV